MVVAELLLDAELDDTVVLVVVSTDDGGCAFPLPGAQAAVNAAAAPNRVTIASFGFLRAEGNSADVSGRADMSSFRAGYRSPPERPRGKRQPHRRRSPYAQRH